MNIDKIISNINTYKCLDINLIKFQELDDSKRVIQYNGQSVFEHTMSVMNLLELKNPITLLSALFHDLGKQYTYDKINELTFKFHNHEQVSALIARQKMGEWGASLYLIDRVVRIVLTHMYDIAGSVSDKTIRQFIADVGVDNINNWFVVRIADSRSYSSENSRAITLIESFRKKINLYFYQQQISNEPLSIDTNHISIQIEGKDN